MTFDLHAYHRALETRWLGRHIEHASELDSTSSHLKRLARAGHEPIAAGRTVIADMQTAGYGQQGRSWVSGPARGLYASVWLPARVIPTPFTLLAGVAAVAALRELMSHEIGREAVPGRLSGAAGAMSHEIGREAVPGRLSGAAGAMSHEIGREAVPDGIPGAEIGLKWVNDLVSRGRKLGGILAEVVGSPSLPERPHGLILGIGINLVPPGLEEAIALSEIGVAPSRDRLLATLWNHLEREIDGLEAAGSGPLLDRWRAAAVTLGTPVRAQLHGEVVSGVAEDISATGALVIRQENGVLRAIESGTVRRADGGYC